MKKLAFVAGIAVVLIIGGGLTAQLTMGEFSLPVLVQTDLPDGSTLAATPWQTEQLVLFIGFILFNLIGMAATIALVMWFLHRGVKQSQSTSTSVTAAKESRQ